ncbi:hypothetical protein N786_03935 [Bacillus amyloliquefaciens UASWS BA1]|nr:hypothetical protein U722_16465 [Bacillus amyloliquefaciens LFB112]ERK85176.1 hypothetical protein N786_03935 [Bacillus amyloliquefaciens UASWS BA1]
MLSAVADEVVPDQESESFKNKVDFKRKRL